MGVGGGGNVMFFSFKRASAPVGVCASALPHAIITGTSPPASVFIDVVICILLNARRRATRSSDPPVTAARGDGEAEDLGRLEVDDQLELARSFDGQVSGSRSVEDLVHVARGTAVVIEEIRAVAYKTSGSDLAPVRIDRWQPHARDVLQHTASLIL